jgi:DNA-binding GntR family transcriptional regulator
VSPQPVIQRTSVRDQVRSEIVRMILRGELPPGSNITESSLSNALSVSRTPVREALLGLEADALVYTDPRRGFFVQELTLTEVRDVYPIMWALEQLAIDLTEEFPPALLKELKQLNQRMRKFGRDPHVAIDLDREWHELLVAQCGNQRLAEDLKRLRTTLRRYEYAYMSEGGLLKGSLAQHDAIVEALAAGDRATAREVLKDNIAISLAFFSEELGGSAGSDSHAGVGLGAAS